MKQEPRTQKIDRISVGRPARFKGLVVHKPEVGGRGKEEGGGGGGGETIMKYFLLGAVKHYMPRCCELERAA